MAPSGAAGSARGPRARAGRGAGSRRPRQRRERTPSTTSTRRGIAVSPSTSAQEEARTSASWRIAPPNGQPSPSSPPITGSIQRSSASEVARVVSVTGASRASSRLRSTRTPWNGRDRDDLGAARRPRREVLGHGAQAAPRSAAAAPSRRAGPTMNTATARARPAGNRGCRLPTARAAQVRPGRRRARAPRSRRPRRRGLARGSRAARGAAPRRGPRRRCRRVAASRFPTDERNGAEPAIVEIAPAATSAAPAATRYVARTRRAAVGQRAAAARARVAERQRAGGRVEHEHAIVGPGLGQIGHHGPRHERAAALVDRHAQRAGEHRALAEREHAARRPIVPAAPAAVSTGVSTTSCRARCSRRGRAPGSGRGTAGSAPGPLASRSWARIQHSGCAGSVPGGEPARQPAGRISSITPLRVNARVSSSATSMGTKRLPPHASHASRGARRRAAGTARRRRGGGTARPSRSAPSVSCPDGAAAAASPRYSAVPAAGARPNGATRAARSGPGSGRLATVAAVRRPSTASVAAARAASSAVSNGTSAPLASRPSTRSPRRPARGRARSARRRRRASPRAASAAQRHAGGEQVLHARASAASSTAAASAACCSAYTAISALPGSPGCREVQSGVNRRAARRASAAIAALSRAVSGLQ